MGETVKIVIAGIGAVGGYYGGVLAKYYKHDPGVEIYFMARGEHLEQIKDNGLKVTKGEDTFIARPELASDDASAFGTADFILVCTKSFDLEAIINQLKPCIGPDTLILPLLNGVDSKERISKILPENTILDGCVYIVSRLMEGAIVNLGKTETLYFGTDGEIFDSLPAFEAIFNDAGLKAHLSTSISTVVWEKFIFISPTATATSYYNCSIGALLIDAEKVKTVTALVAEVKQVALARGIHIPEDITEKTMHKLEVLPYATTSSMHTDILNQNPHNELESLTGYVVRAGEELGVETPVYKALYEGLKVRKAAVSVL